MVSHAIKSRPRRLFECMSRAGNIALLLNDTVFGVEAVLEVLGVLVGGVLDEQLARGGALEGLEARLALDGLCAGVLRPRKQTYMMVRAVIHTDFSWLFASLGPLSAARSRFCCALRSR